MWIHNRGQGCKWKFSTACHKSGCENFEICYRNHPEVIERSNSLSESMKKKLEEMRRDQNVESTDGARFSWGSCGEYH